MVDKMKKNNIVTVCIFVILLVAIVPTILAISPTNHTVTSPTNHVIKQSNLPVDSPTNYIINVQSNHTVTSPINHTGISPTNHIINVQSNHTTTHSIVSKNQCPCIVFRLDDVQESYLSDVQTKIMEEFQKKNASLTIGVIGYDFHLDTKLISHLKDNLTPGHATIEVANHGWKHENFALLNSSQQVSLINKTNQELLKTLGKKPNVFITPYNMYNNDTLKALKQTKMKLISSGIWQDDKFVTAKGKIVENKDSLGIYHIPSMTDFQIVIGSESYWINIPKDKVIASIDSHISKYGYDVVLLHPQNFAQFVEGQYVDKTNNVYLDELSSLIDYAKSRHIKITTLSDIVGLKDPPNIKPLKTILNVVVPKTNSTLSLTTNANIPTGSLVMNLKYFSGDRVGVSKISMKIYQDFNLTPFVELHLISTNPYEITMLPLYHQYKIKTYVDGMLSSINLVTLDNPEQNLDVNIPDGGSILASVYYNDGQTPIPNATVSIRSQDNKTRENGVTDIDGLAPRFYLASTNTPDNYYVVDAKINSHLIFSSQPITLPPGNANEIKLITPWPPMIQNLITIKVYNQTKLLSHVGAYVIDMYDNHGNKITESPVNIHGEGNFWSMKVGDYIFNAVDVASGKLLGSLNVTIDGTKNDFAMVLQKQSSTT